MAVAVLTLGNDRVNAAGAAARCAAPDALLRAGEQSAAKAQYIKILQDHPDAACASSALKNMNAREGIASRILTRSADLAPKVVEALGLLLLAIFAVLMLGYIRGAHRWLVLIPGVGQLLSPRLTITTFSETGEPAAKSSEALVARIRERISRMRHTASLPTHTELDTATPREEFASLVATDSGLRNALDKASDLSSQTKYIAALVNLLYALLPVRRLTVDGVVAPDETPTAQKCASATVSLQQGARLVDASTIVGPGLERDPLLHDYLSLADPIAVWIQFEVARLLANSDISPEAAESYALVRAGVDRQLVNDLESARALYTQALQRDRSNWAAHINLAIVEARLLYLETAINDLNRAVTNLEGIIYA